jgi:hypothetical protein
MLHVRRYIVLTVAAAVVAGPLLYFHCVGRQAPLLVGYCGCLAPRDQWRYGWPAIYGTRIITQAWAPTGDARTVGPLDDFSGWSLFWNLGVSAVMIVGSIYVLRNTSSALRKRQLSLRSLLLLPVVIAGICIFVKYDRSPDLLHCLAPSTLPRFNLTGSPIIFRPQAITDFPLYVSAPMLFGVAAGIYASLLAVTTLVALLFRMAYRGSAEAPARNARHRVLAIAALVCLIVGTAYLARAAYRFRTVCRAAVCGKLATDWVNQYVWIHDGEWPRSWDALRQCAADCGSNSERTIETVQSYVEIDFLADPRVVATQTAGEFRAIRPLDGYGVDHQEYWDVPFLIETLRDLNDRAANPPQPQSVSPPGGAGRGRVVD